MNILTRRTDLADSCAKANPQVGNARETSITQTTETILEQTASATAELHGILGVLSAQNQGTCPRSPEKPPESLSEALCLLRVRMGDLQMLCRAIKEELVG
jgi:hypothetical protein